MRKPQSKVLPAAIFIICAGVRRPIRARFLADAEAVEGLVAVGTDQALASIRYDSCFADFVQDLVGVHWVGSGFGFALRTGLCLR